MTACRFLVCIAALLASETTLAQPCRPGAAGNIDVSNVSQMTLCLALPTGQTGAHSGAPIFEHDRLFIVTPFPHSVLALDLTRSGAPVLWRYSPPSMAMASGLATRNATTNGAVLSSGRLFLNTFDGHTIALDSATGNVLWNVPTTAVDRGETLLAAPMVAGDRVFIGNNGSDFGVRGWMAALDAASGQILWKRFNTGPDSGVGIGEGFAYA